MTREQQQLRKVAEAHLWLKTLDEPGLFLLKQLIQHIESPKAPIEVPTDAIERWAFGRKEDVFRPSLVLWADWLRWCTRVGERPGTQPAFWAELKKRPWLHPSRTWWERVVKPREGGGPPRVAKAATQGWRGLRT